MYVWLFKIWDADRLKILSFSLFPSTRTSQVPLFIMFNPLLLVATILSALLVSILPPLVAPDLYNQCFFHYSSATLKFDNTAWTWATDYGLSVWMGFGIIPLLRNAAAKKGGVISLLSHNSAMLLLCYASSVFFGAVCHQVRSHSPLNMRDRRA